MQKTLGGGRLDAPPPGPARVKIAEHFIAFPSEVALLCELAWQTTMRPITVRKKRGVSSYSLTQYTVIETPGCSEGYAGKFYVRIYGHSLKLCLQLTAIRLLVDPASGYVIFRHSLMMF